MLEAKEHHEIAVSSERSFGLVFSVFFALVALYPVIFADGRPFIWAAVTAAIFLAITFIRPAALKPLNQLWFAFGMLLGKIVAPLVMLLVFCLSVVPVGLIARLAGKDFLTRKKPSAQQTSFWVSRENEKQSNMTNQF